MRKIAALFTAVLAASSVAQARVQKCTPVGNSHWSESRIEALQNGAQVLEQVRASGAFLVADLICSFETCVGFVNGNKADGVLERNSDGPNKLIINGDDVVPTTEFICD